VIPDLLRDVLACPVDKAPVSLDEHRSLLVCSVCQRGYPVRDGIPVMLVDEAVTGTDESARPGG
jgi:uncharacterized protein